MFLYLLDRGKFDVTCINSKYCYIKKNPLLVRIIAADYKNNALLRKEFFMDMKLPFLPPRWNLEKTKDLKPRRSPVEDFFDEKEFLPINNLANNEINDFKIDFGKSEDDIVEEMAKKIINKGKEEINPTQPKPDGEISMSVDEMNELRKKLGLPLLQ